MAAIVWYGDPRFVAGKPFDKGTSMQNGVRIKQLSCSPTPSIDGKQIERFLTIDTRLMQDQLLRAVIVLVA